MRRILRSATPALCPNSQIRTKVSKCRASVIARRGGSRDKHSRKSWSPATKSCSGSCARSCAAAGSRKSLPRASSSPVAAPRWKVPSSSPRKFFTFPSGSACRNPCAACRRWSGIPSSQPAWGCCSTHEITSCPRAAGDPWAEMQSRCWTGCVPGSRVTFEADDYSRQTKRRNKSEGNASAAQPRGVRPKPIKRYERVGARNMFELMDAYSQSAVIKVIGVGGGGGNAVAHMVTSGIDGVEFMCINTDSQALKHAKVKTALQIGCNITKGLGAGADPEVGRQAAMEDRDRIVELVEGCDMLFITAGMGGGTGTGAAPVVAQVAKELGILTVAVVTKPFEMEGNKRGFVADHGIAELGKYCDSLITIPNQKLLTVLGPQTTLLDAFKSANQVLQGAVQGIAELITRPGLINVDFADVRTVMAETGMAMMGSGSASGEGRAREAAEMAVSSPLLEDINLAGAHGILVNVTAGMDLSIGEFQEVGQIVKQFASEDATVVVGTVIDPELSNVVRVTVVATGLGRPAAARPMPAPHREATPVREQSHHRDPLNSRAPPAISVVRRGPLSNSDYAALDKPTV